MTTLLQTLLLRTLPSDTDPLLRAYIETVLPAMEQEFGMTPALGGSEEAHYYLQKQRGNKFAAENAKRYASRSDQSLLVHVLNALLTGWNLLPFLSSALALSEDEKRLFCLGLTLHDYNKWCQGEEEDSPQASEIANILKLCDTLGAQLNFDAFWAEWREYLTEIAYRCNLTLHDNVFFATREMGILYETEKYLHNWALSYALFGSTHIPRPYRLQGAIAQRPGYLEADNEQNLLYLNEAGIYVFPALPLQWSYQVNTFKAAQVNYYGKAKQFGDKGADRNYPINYGRAKEIAVGSQYRVYILARDSIEIPHWIRLGKWAAKIQVEAKLIPTSGVKQYSGEYTCEHPLNPIDLTGSNRLLLYNRIVMPPSSLVSQARLSGDYWEISLPSNSAALPEWSNLQDLPNQVCLPRGTAYGASTIAVTA